MYSNVHSSTEKRIFVAGATGYIGRQLVRELVAQGFRVVCFARVPHNKDLTPLPSTLDGAEVRFGDVCDAESLQNDGFRGESFDAVFSCISTRNGGIDDAQKVDYRGNLNLLAAAQKAGVAQFVLLSAICVQKPRLAFQYAKLAFEKELIASGMTYSIVRPTAYFKSLAGQVEAVMRGKPFTFFGDGTLTACKPIAEADLARFMVSCLREQSRKNAVLPIGGPGEAITPREQAKMLFELCGRPAKYRRIPVAIFDVMAAVLNSAARLFPVLRDKAEFVRIGRYYATESMLWLNPNTGEYDAVSTPAYGTVTLRDFYQEVLEQGLAGQELGDHAWFGSRQADVPPP